MDLLGYPPYALIGGPRRAVWDAEFISYCWIQIGPKVIFAFRLALAHQGLKLYDIALSIVEQALARPAIDSENAHLISLKKKLVEQQNAMAVSRTDVHQQDISRVQGV